MSHNCIMEQYSEARSKWEAQIRQQIDKKREYDHLNTTLMRKAISLNYIYEYAKKRNLEAPSNLADYKVPPIADNGVMKAMVITEAGGFMTYFIVKHI